MSIFPWKNGLFSASGLGGGWADDTEGSTAPSARQLNVEAGFGDAASTAGIAMAGRPKLTMLVSFTGANGVGPTGGLIADAAGDLFGTTYGGGAQGDGTVFEIAKTEGGYAGKPTTLVNFTGADGENPKAGLFADAVGDLFGTTDHGGANGDGTVFEIAKTRSGYAGVATTLVDFNGDDGRMPESSLIADAAGDLFGTTGYGGTDDDGTAFEIVKTKHGYAGAPTTIASFTGSDGQNPFGNLIADAAGDLFGTTFDGGGAGTVFEIVKTRHGYASAPTTLVSFTGADGFNPYSGLIADGAGDLFGTTYLGGADGYGTVFEIAKTRHGYAGAPTTLVSFTSSNGANPDGSLIIDAAGNLFGTTHLGGSGGYGTVFEIANSKGGYASAPTTLANFTGANGANPSGSLTVGAGGELIGTTDAGGPDGDGTVFKIVNSGFIPPASPVTSAEAGGIRPSPLGAAFVQAMAATTGHGEMAGLFNARTRQDGHQQLLAMPRFATV